MKKIAIGTKPTKAKSDASADAWVEKRATASDEVMKRLTIDVSASLHGRLKAQCALRGEKMADVIRALLEEHFPEAG